MATLTVSEYRRILAVLKRDAALRKLEVERINKLRSSLQSDSEDSGCARCVSPSSQRKCSACVKNREVTLQTGDWFYKQLQGRFCKNNNNNPAIENGEAMDAESTQVREFIERLVEALVSGQLDDVKVNRLYTHPEYDRMFSCHHSMLCETLVQLSFALQMAMSNKSLPEEDTPTAVHTTLKQRVQNIIQEAMTLPNLKSQVPTQNSNATHKWDEDITAKSYEDILATAILNKVIERFQQRTGIVLCDGNSNLLQHRNTASPESMDSSPKYTSQVEIGVIGPSSLEDGDSSSLEGIRSWSESSHTEPISMTIEECIEEEVTTYNSDGEEEEETRPASELDFYLSGLNFIKQRRVPFPELGVDIVHDDEVEEDEEACESPQPTDLVSPIDSWEENWLFQRRRLKLGGSIQNTPMPVPMLVPNPSEDYRALIGDRDAEEVSDLSDCSEGALEDVVLAGVDTTDAYIDVMHSDLTNVSVNISTQQTYQLNEEEEEEETEEEQVRQMEEVDQHRHQLIVPETNSELVKTTSLECLSEFGQQDSEYTEDYASVTQRKLSSLTLTNEPTAPVPKPRSHVPQPSKPEPENNTIASELTTPPRPGTIAEREHLKWQSAVPLPNNPYSPENISKRLNRRSSDLFNYSAPRSIPDLAEETVIDAPLQVVCTSSEPDYKKYGRDYYINQSKCASGARQSIPKKSPEMMEAEQDSGVDTSDTSQLGGHVEVEVARWQKEIDQTEQQWLKNMSTKHNNSMIQNSQNGHTESSNLTSREDKQLQSEWNVAPSECSTVSSDFDLDADVPIVLPSVKELAKQFSGGATSDSDTSLPKVNRNKAVPTSRRKVESQNKSVEPPRPYLTSEKREIHSLTARSISREFREGLRRNLPTRLDRNVHGKTDSTSSSPEPINCVEGTKMVSNKYNAKPLPINGGTVHDTTPGYTSDESGTRSPTPPIDSRQKLQSNIAFWEKLSGK